MFILVVKESLKLFLFPAGGAGVESELEMKIRIDINETGNGKAIKNGWNQNLVLFKYFRQNGGCINWKKVTSTRNESKNTINLTDPERIIRGTPKDVYTNKESNLVEWEMIRKRNQVKKKTQDKI